MVRIFFSILLILFSNILHADEVSTSTSVSQTTTVPPPVPGAPVKAVTTTITTSKNITSDQDAFIQSGIKDKYAKSTTLTGTDISVISKDGMVTLTGTVTTQSQADEAIKIAKETNGVVDVTSEITIKTKTNPVPTVP